MPPQSPISLAAIAQQASADEVLGAAVTIAREHLGAGAAFVAVRRSPGNFAITARDGLRDPRWETVVVHDGRGLGGRVVAQEQTTLAGNYLEDETITGDYRELVRAEGLQSVVCVPVTGADGLTALLYIGERSVGGVGGRAVAEAERVAEMIGVGLHHAARAAPLASLAAQARAALELDDGDALRALALRVAGGGAPAPGAAAVRLTAREFDVLQLLGAGASNQQIAAQLVLAESTVKGYVRDLRAKLGARSRLDAVLRAQAAGLL